MDEFEAIETASTGVAVCYAMAESGDIEGQREGGDFFVKVQIY